jgi:hypothetical protein
MAIEQGDFVEVRGRQWLAEAINAVKGVPHQGHALIGAGARLPGPSSVLPRSSSRAAIASGSRCYSPISNASCDLADLD